MSNQRIGAVERDDYGARADGSWNIWIIRVVRGPIVVKGDRLTHGGQLAARACRTRLEALSVARELSRIFGIDLERGARFILEPGFYSKPSMPGARQVVFSRDALVGGSV